MNNPLNAPTPMPVAMPTSVHTKTEASMSAGSMLAARTALTNEITAPADRSKPPDRMTNVCPNAANAKGVAPLIRKEMSK